MLLDLAVGYLLDLDQVDEPLEHGRVGLAVGHVPQLEVGVQNSVVAVVARGGRATEAAVDLDPGELLLVELDDQVVGGLVPFGFGIDDGGMV